MDTFSIGVDLGGTNLRFGAYTADFRLLGSRTIRTRVSAGPESVSKDICDGVRDLMQQFSSEHTLKGIGVGTPGPLELPKGKFGQPPNLPGFEGFELKEALQNDLQHAVYIECDANAAALAECRAGAGKAHQENSLCMLTLGTGVGSGIVLRGEVWHGMSGMAGESGHTSVFADGPLCSCGSRGCLELYASATGIRRMASEMAEQGSTDQFLAALRLDSSLATADFARLAAAGDLQAIRLFQEAGRCLGLSLAGLVNDLNLPLYVIGGGVAKAWNLFAPTMLQTLTQFSYVYRLTQYHDSDHVQGNRTHVVPASLGSQAGLLGASMLPYAFLTA